jgi:hypothetical protein
MLLVTAASACGDGPCGNSEDRAVPLSELPCNTTRESGVWESHPLPPIDDEACYWFEFRGCSRYRFENPLDAAPTVIIGYTSFDPDGEFLTVGSGNSFVVEEVSDSEVTLRNAQNQLFYLRLVLE